MHKSEPVWEETIAWSRVVAGCVVKQNGKYLMVQEKQPKAYGLWNVPAGHVDKDEAIEDTAVRETSEETGLQVRLLRKIGIYHDAVEFPIKHAFMAEVTGGTLRTQADEILQAAWLTFAEIAKLNDDKLIRAPWVWEVIQQVEQEVSE